MNVRDARPADAAAWRSIVLEAANEASQIVTHPSEVSTEEALAQKFGAVRGPSPFLVVEEDGEVVGALGLVRGDRAANRHTAELGLSVRAAWRGKGAGTALLRAAEARARGFGVRKLCLGVFTTNERARRLYERHGYAEEGVRHRHFVVGGVERDETLMAKWLG